MRNCILKIIFLFVVLAGIVIYLVEISSEKIIKAGKEKYDELTGVLLLDELKNIKNEYADSLINLLGEYITEQKNEENLSKFNETILRIKSQIEKSDLNKENYNIIKKIIRDERSEKN